MSVDNFIPEIWVALIVEHLHKSLVYGNPQVINRDYEGQIRERGDTVHIPSIGPVTVSDYTTNTDMAAPENPSDGKTTLQITEQKYFNISVDDIDKRQGNVEFMTKLASEAAYSLADTADQFIAALYTDAATANNIGSTASPKTNLNTLGAAYSYLNQLSTKLTEANVPKMGRVAVVPPWYTELLVEDERFSSFGTDANRSVLENGQVSERKVAGFTLFESNNVPNTSGDKWRITAGHPSAWTFAEQLRTVEPYRVERQFGDGLKGLLLYGAKVVRPDCLAVLTANRPS